MARASCWDWRLTEIPFFNAQFVGNETYILERFGSDLWTTWSAHCRQEGERPGYDTSALGDTARITEPINADIAASTQLLFEETYLAAVRSLGKMLAGDAMMSSRWHWRWTGLPLKAQTTQPKPPRMTCWPTRLSDGFKARARRDRAPSAIVLSWPMSARRRIGGG